MDTYYHQFPELQTPEERGGYVPDSSFTYKSTVFGCLLLVSVLVFVNVSLDRSVCFSAILLLFMAPAHLHFGRCFMDELYTWAVHSMARQHARSKETSSQTITSTFPQTHLLDLFSSLPTPSAEHRRSFEARAPVLGLSLADIKSIEHHASDASLFPVQQRDLFHLLRSNMLRSLISTDQLSTTAQLCDKLRSLAESDLPSPVPDWYVYSEVTVGPRRIGYYACDNRYCFDTENVDKKKFSKCAVCKGPRYCSKVCQSEDWNARHKFMCETVKEGALKMKITGDFMQFLTDAVHDDGDNGGGGTITEIIDNIDAGLDQSDEIMQKVAKRRAKLKKEKKRR
jgi:hypothetical protein